MEKKTIQLEIAGMTCDHCAESIEKALKKKSGVVDANVLYTNRQAEIDYDRNETSQKEIMDLINSTGNYKAKEKISKNPGNNHYNLVTGRPGFRHC